VPFGDVLGGLASTMLSKDAERRTVPLRAHPGRVFVVAFLLVLAAMGAWSAATPLYAAPDEPVQVIKAAAVVRGQLLGNFVGASQPAYGRVEVPAFFAASESLPDCFHRRATVSASCEPAATTSSASTSVWIYDARYPPLYYAIVGLPSLLGVGTWVVYLMRLVSAALCSLLVALAVMAAQTWSRSRVVLIGVVVATTPMVLFLGGVVNASGLEVSAAIATWTCGVVLFLEHIHDPPPALVAALALSASVWELTRGISPFWLACTLAVLLAVADWRHLAAFFGRRSVLTGLAAVAVLGAAALAWTFTEHSLDVISASRLGPTPEVNILETSFAHNDYYLPGMIGVFGWFDTYSPTFTYVVWYGLVAVLGLGAAAVVRLRQAFALAVLALAIVLVPVIISSSQVHRYDYTWSGRDTLPLAVGLPILAAALLGRSVVSAYRGRLAAIVGALAVAAQMAAFFEALRRYAVGTKGADFGFLLHSPWHPPLGFALTIAIEAVGLVGLVAFVQALVRTGRTDEAGLVGVHRRGMPPVASRGRGVEAGGEERSSLPTEPVAAGDGEWVPPRARVPERSGPSG